MTEPDGSGADGGTTPPAPDGTRPRSRWRGGYTPEDTEAAKQQWREMRPWASPMPRADKVLVGAVLAVLALGLVSLPLRPFLLASHPVLLAAVTGSTSAIGAGAAFARVGDTSLWLVVAAGVVGKVKFDWLWWWAGRRWGAKGVRFFVPSQRAQRFVERVRSWPAWALPLVVVASSFPGVPSLLAFLLAGLAGMRLVTFLVADVVGAALLSGLVAGLGYALGQQAVDVVLAVDRYALWISLAIVVVVGARAGRSPRGGAARSTPPATDRG